MDLADSSILNDSKDRSGLSCYNHVNDLKDVAISKDFNFSKDPYHSKGLNDLKDISDSAILRVPTSFK